MVRLGPLLLDRLQREQMEKIQAQRAVYDLEKQVDQLVDCAPDKSPTIADSA